MADGRLCPSAKSSIAPWCYTWNGWMGLGWTTGRGSGKEHLAKIATDNLSQKNHQSAIKILKTALSCFQNTFLRQQTFFVPTQIFSQLLIFLSSQLTDWLTLKGRKHMKSRKRVYWKHHSTFIAPLCQSVQPFFVILFRFFPQNDNDQLKYIILCLLDSLSDRKL